MDFLTFATIVLAGITALYGLAVSAWFVMYQITKKYNGYEK